MPGARFRAPVDGVVADRTFSILSGLEAPRAEVLRPYVRSEIVVAAVAMPDAASALLLLS